MKIIFDTNFIVASIEFKLDVFDILKGNELFLAESVVNELEKLSESNKYAKIALEILEAKKLKILKSKRTTADPDLLEFGRDGYIIATQDVKLKKRLKDEGIQVLTIRQRKKIEKV